MDPRRAARTLLNTPVLWIFIAFTLCKSARAVDFAQCLTDVQNGVYGPDPGAVDEYGNTVTNLSEAAGITYDLCVRACGDGLEPFQWSLFSQSFGAWLLPWLALVSQLPFGSKHSFDDLLSVMLAVGSPTLAGYSLALTILNSRYAARRFSGVTYPNAKVAFRVMSSLQQTAVELNEDLLPSLVVLHKNDGWWKDLVDRLDYVHSWSVSAATSLAWVFIAYLFTVIDSFTALAGDSDPIASPGVSDGQAVGSVWLWLLAIVIGWLQVSPKCDDRTVKRAMRNANRIAFVAEKKGRPRKASQVSEERAMYIVEEREGDNKDGARDDERASAPIYNYARFLPWTQNVERVVQKFRNADIKAVHHVRPDVGTSNDGAVADTPAQTAPEAGGDPSTVEETDEGEHSAPLTAEPERMTHATQHDSTDSSTGTTRDISTQMPELDRSASWYGSEREDEINPLNRTGTIDQLLNYCGDANEHRSHWGPEVFSRFFIAAVAGLGLQWGTAGASMIILWFTPTKGMGCRSASYLLYASLSTFVWILLVASSVLVHASDQLRQKNRRHLRVVVRQFSIILRRVGKLLAVLNAIWITISCVLQFSNVYNTCKCNVQLIMLLRHMYSGAYDVMVISPNVVRSLKEPWGGGVLLGLGTIVLYAGFVNLFINPLV